MNNTKFNRKIEVNGQMLDFHFLMGNGNYRSNYRIICEGSNQAFWMKNWVDNGFTFQFEDINKVPSFLTQDKNLQKKLNDVILETWHE